MSSEPSLYGGYTYPGERMLHWLHCIASPLPSGSRVDGWLGGNGLVRTSVAPFICIVFGCAIADCEVG